MFTLLIYCITPLHRRVSNVFSQNVSVQVKKNLPRCVLTVCLYTFIMTFFFKMEVHVGFLFIEHF